MKCFRRTSLNSKPCRFKWHASEKLNSLPTSFFPPYRFPNIMIFKEIQKTKQKTKNKNKTKQNKTKQNKTKQNKTKQNKTNNQTNKTKQNKKQ